MSYEAQITSHYGSIRSRLMGPVARRVAQRIPVPATKTATETAVALIPRPVFEEHLSPVVDQVVFDPFSPTPLNMMTACTWRFLVAVAAAKHGIAAKDIMGESRHRKIVAARYEAIKLVYQHTPKSLPQVGLCFARDHSTVHHALRKTGGKEKMVPHSHHMPPNAFMEARHG